MPGSFKTRRQRRPLGNLGNAYQRNGDQTKAIECFELAIPKLRETGNWNGVFLAYDSLVNLLINSGRATDAIRQLQAELELTVELKSDRRQMKVLSRIGAAHAIIGQKHLVTSHFEEAISSFRKGLELASSLRDEAMQAELKSNIETVSNQLLVLKRLQIVISKSNHKL